MGGITGAARAGLKLIDNHASQGRGFAMPVEQKEMKEYAFEVSRSITAR